MLNWAVRHKTWIRWVSTGITVILMAGIFFFSAQGIESADLSDAVAYKVLDADVFDFSVFSAVSSGRKTVDLFVRQMVRKAAHVVLYLALGFSLRVCLESWLGKRKGLMIGSALMGIIYGATDELHQLFVPGRSGELSDVILDGTGVLAGVLLATGIIFLIRKTGRPSVSSPGEVKA